MLLAAPAVRARWEGPTPLARNEWICWIESARQVETRRRRIEVGIDKQTGGMRRPCCWPGCAPRPDKQAYDSKARRES